MTVPPDAAGARRRGRVRALLLCLLLAEIIVLLVVAREVGVVGTIALLFLGSALGAWVIRHEGARAWQALGSAAASGRLPDDRFGDSVLVLVGGLLLFVPGFLSDLAGLLFVLPFTRRPARMLLGRVLARRPSWQPRGVFIRRYPGGPAGPAGWSGPGGTDVVQGEIVSDDEPTPPTEPGDDGAGRTS